MSSCSGDSSSDEDRSPGAGERSSPQDSFRQRVTNLREKYRDIVQEGFFRNLEHDWLPRQRPVTAAEPNLSSSSSTLLSTPVESLRAPSGSFIVLNGRKFPLEFFRQPNAADPPEPVQLEPASKRSEKAYDAAYERNPYAVPTREEIARSNASKNRFHTARSRAREGIRERLRVQEEVLPADEELLGPAGSAKKYRTRLATQLDAYYRGELTYRPRIRNFARVDAIHGLRDSGRRQFETYYRQEYIVGQTRKHRIEDESYQWLAERCVELRQAVRTIRQERFSATMRVLDTLKPYFEKSEMLEKRHRELQARMTALWNQVVRLESVWVRRLKLQNFLYLIMPMKWRERYDWIHRADGSSLLEGYPESIARRDVVNMRDINAGNDIWAVKRFYEQEFLAKDKPIHPAFASPDELLHGVAELNTNSMTLLSRLDLMNWVKTNAESESAALQRSFAAKIQSIRRFIQDTDERRKFYEQRTRELRARFEQLVDGPLRETVHSERARQIESLVAVTYGKLHPTGDHQESSSSSSIKLSGITCFAFIFDTVLQLLADFDRLPAEQVRAIEQNVRFRRRRSARQAVKAAEEEQRVRQLAVQLNRALAPPYVKPDRKIKRPLSRLRRKESPVEVVPKRVSKLDEIFRLAFGEGATMTTDERRNFEIDLMYQNYCAVQFDHFLRTIGYEPDYDVVSRVQERDGPEERFFKRKELVPLVLKKLQRWQRMQQLLRERLFRKMSQELQAIQER